MKCKQNTTKKFDFDGYGFVWIHQSHKNSTFNAMNNTLITRAVLATYQRGISSSAVACKAKKAAAAKV